MAANRRRGDWLELLAGAGVGAWGWRLELGLLVVLVGVQRLLARVLGELAAGVLVAGLVATVLAVVPARRLIWRMLRRAWVRRAWRRAVVDAGLALGPLRAPRVL